MKEKIYVVKSRRDFARAQGEIRKLLRIPALKINVEVHSEGRVCNFLIKPNIHCIHDLEKLN